MFVLRAVKRCTSHTKMCLMTHTTELSLEEDLEVVSASQVAQQLKKAEGPALYSTLSGNLNSGHKHKKNHILWTQLECLNWF